MMETLSQDLRYGLRLLTKSPGFTAVAVLTLALGIGANTAIFSLGNALLLRPLPGVEKPDQLVALFTSDFSGSRYSGSSYPDFLDFRAQCKAFAGLAAFVDSDPINLTTGGEPQRILGALVTGDYFPVLNVKSVCGRTLLPEDDEKSGGQRVAVLSYELWQRRFGGESGLIGTNIGLNGRSFTVVGVAPRDFKGTRLDAAPDVWMPMSTMAEIHPAWQPSQLTRRGGRWLRLIGRLDSTVTVTQAQVQLETVMSQLAQAYPKSNLGTLSEPNQPRPVTVVAANQAMIWPGARDETKRVTQLLMGLAGFVLLIACVNMANFMLARAQRRRKEVAMRLALGATRVRILRQMLTESLLLSALGGAVGLLLAMWVSDLLPTLNLFSSFVGLKLSLDVRVLSFTLAIVVVTSLLFGLAPALQASRADLLPALKNAELTIGDAPRRFGLRKLLVIPQVALSLILLIAAGLFLRSLQRAYATDLGFNVENVLLASVDVGPLGYAEAQGQAFFEQLQERAEALPGALSVTLASFVPVNDNGNRNGVTVEGYTPGDGEDMEINLNSVGPNYFKTMGIPLLLGRDFGLGDSAAAPKVVIINEAMARRYWPDQSPIGKRISLEGARGPFTEIVGVVKTTKYRQMREDALPYMYLPFSQMYQPEMNLIVRTAGDPTSLVPALRAEVQRLDQNIPLFGVRTLTEHLADALAPERTNAALSGIFGLLALLLAGVGMYGVMSYTVTERTREIGIRAALGAQRADVLRLIMGQGMILTVFGVLTGLGAAFALKDLIASLLFGVSAADPVTFAVIPLVLTAVALLACYLPARRATKVDPMIALRYE